MGSVRCAHALPTSSFGRDLSIELKSGSRARFKRKVELGTPYFKLSSMDFFDKLEVNML